MRFSGFGGKNRTMTSHLEFAAADPRNLPDPLEFERALEPVGSGFATNLAAIYAAAERVVAAAAGGAGREAQAAFRQVQATGICDAATGYLQGVAYPRQAALQGQTDLSVSTLLNHVQSLA
jgi:hypothetical protein